jgi:hypothetical protein
MKKNVILFGILVLVIGTALFFYFKDQNSSIKDNPFTQFAIEDTSSVTKIFIADHDGNTALLERSSNSRLWDLNKKYKAREDAIVNLLQVINRVRVRGNVASTARDNMMKIIATSGKKVEIYTNGSNTPDKIYYIGPNTADHTGTIMLLEIPSEGKSAEPYICHMEGFTGFLNPRFFAQEMEWRYTGIFDFPKLEISKIEVQHSVPDWSFEINYQGGNRIQLSHLGQNIPQFDTAMVKDFLLHFKKVHLESYRTFLKPTVEDSIRHSPPVVRLVVTDNKKIKRTLSLYLKKGKEGTVDANGKLTPWDPEYLWGTNDKGELGLAQRYVMDPITLPIQSFLSRK